MAPPQERIYTTADIYALPEGERAELIDGHIYMMAPPSRIHQRLVHQLERRIGNYIDAKKGGCEVYPAPFAVFLDKDGLNYVEPDISVICSKDLLDDRGCHGAPDWVIEIVSPSTQQMDYMIKLFKYRAAKVREYWIVNPMTRTVNVYDLEKGQDSRQYSFDDQIPVCIYPDLSIQINSLLP